MKSDPNNSRQEVDAGLKAWSHQAKSFGQLYREIMAQYPGAERSLAKFYRVEYRKSAREADAMAKQALDMAFRAHFTFSGQRPSIHSSDLPGSQAEAASAEAKSR